MFLTWLKQGKLILKDGKTVIEHAGSIIAYSVDSILGFPFGVDVDYSWDGEGGSTDDDFERFTRRLSS